jgi:hypothetical protein
MSFLGAILSVIAGLAIMSFGLLLFYAWLPLCYGLFGFDIGLLLGRSLTGDVGLSRLPLALSARLFSQVQRIPSNRIGVFSSASRVVFLSDSRLRRRSTWIVPAAAS